MPESYAAVMVIRESGGMITSQCWHVSPGQADVLSEGLTERLGAPGESMCPLSATDGNWDRLAEAGAVMVMPEAAR